MIQMDPEVKKVFEKWKKLRSEKNVNAEDIDDDNADLPEDSSSDLSADELVHDDINIKKVSTIYLLNGDISIKSS